MSYDLWFDTAGTPITALDLRSHFAQRPCFQVSEGQAFYENESTGVYFSFEIGPQEGHNVPCAFNINYFRPHVFGLEAEPELTAFVRRFGLTVDDPQMDGMGQGPYSPEGFLRGWNAGNAFGHRAILSQHDGETTLLSLPRERVEAFWNWNASRDALMGEFEVMLSGGFVPTVMFLVTPDAPGEVKAIVVWGDAIPIAIPDGIDQVILVGEGAEVPRHLPIDAVRPLIADYERVEAGSTFPGPDGERTIQAAYTNVFYEEPPAALREALFALPGVDYGEQGPYRVSADQVLTREVLEAARG